MKAVLTIVQWTPPVNRNHGSTLKISFGSVFFSEGTVGTLGAGAGWGQTGSVPRPFLGPRMGSVALRVTLATPFGFCLGLRNLNQS